MSKNKNGGLDQYGKVQSLNVIGGERVKRFLCGTDVMVYSCINPFTADPVKALHFVTARMSKIKNGVLDQYGAEPFEQQQFGTAGVEGVK